MNLKEKLLETGCFEDNEWLDKYVQLIETNFNGDVYSEKHHIIPIGVFKYINRVVDNSSENIKLLPYSNHILAHFYLLKCSKIDAIRDKNACALRIMLHNKIEHFDDIENNLEIISLSKKI